MDNQIQKFYNDFVIVVNSTNLYSSVCDAVNLIHLIKNIFQHSYIYVLSNDQNTTTTITRKVNILEVDRVIYITSENLIDDLQNVVMSIKHNFIFSLSSHGYANRDKNYINWNRKKITDQQLHDIISNNIISTLHCLCLIDTCQSGTMMNLNYQTKDLVSYKSENPSNSKLNIVCIGAVDDNEYDQDDISDFGYGGGLTSAFIDFMNNSNNDKTIKIFFIYYINRIAPLNHHPVLSVNLY